MEINLFSGNVFISVPALWRSVYIPVPVSLYTSQFDLFSNPPSSLQYLFQGPKQQAYFAFFILNPAQLRFNIHSVLSYPGSFSCLSLFPVVYLVIFQNSAHPPLSPAPSFHLFIFLLPVSSFSFLHIVSSFFSSSSYRPLPSVRVSRAVRDVLGTFHVARAFYMPSTLFTSIVFV